MAKFDTTTKAGMLALAVELDAVCSRLHEIRRHQLGQPFYSSVSSAEQSVLHAQALVFQKVGAREMLSSKTEPAGGDSDG
jgi:hypothetical protein